MRNKIFRAVTVAVVGFGALCGAYTLGSVQADAAIKCGREDSTNWHAAYCGNRSMGVKIDVTPNNPYNGQRWVILKFNKDGKTGTFKPRGF